MPHVLFFTPGLRYVRSHPTTNEPEGIRRRAGAGGAYFFDGKKNNKEIKYFTIGVFQPNVSVSTTTTTTRDRHIIIFCFYQSPDKNKISSHRRTFDTFSLPCYNGNIKDSAVGRCVRFDRGISVYYFE